MDDMIAYQARDAHRQSVKHAEHAARFRRERDKLIRRLYSSGECSYGQLARRVGCSPELVAKVIQGRQ